MGIPNTLVKIINKHNEIVDFDIFRIKESIKKAILDVEDIRARIPDQRAQKYAERITARVYREYYDIEWLKQDLIKRFINFNNDERKKRLKDTSITIKTAYILLEEFKDSITSGTLQEKKSELHEFIYNEIDKTKVDSSYITGLFPQLNTSEKNELTDFLLQQILSIDNKKIPLKYIIPTREFVQDTIEKELKDIGEVDIAEGYMIYREGRKKLRSGEITPLQFTNNGVHKELIRETLLWNIENQCDTVFGLNDWVYGGHGKDIKDLIHRAEKRYRDSVLAAVEKIKLRKDEIKLVIIAGPSCSNKTTTTVIIGQELKKEGLKLKQLNVDDYFKNLDDQPKDEFGDYDFEMPEAIDIPLLNKNLEGLLSGHKIQKPCYNFKTGIRDGYADFSLDEDEIILIDCLHGLYRKLTSSVAQNQKFSIYIESMNEIRNTNGANVKWADVRMLKRMIRDYQHRGYNPEKTLGHWPYVRKGELKHIIPYIFSTDVVINSGLPYELSALKTALKNVFPGKDFIHQLRIDGRLDPYIRGVRVGALLETVAEMPNLDIIPGTSPIREFIGGSEYIIPHN